MKRAENPCRFRVLAGLVLLMTAAAVGNVDPRKGRVSGNPTAGNRYSIEQEVQYGRQAIPEIEEELPLLPVDHPVSKYIDALGHRLAAKAPGFEFPYSFRVVNQKEINAFAFPGGTIYVTIYPKGGANADSVAYGTIISGFTPSRSSKDLDQAMRELVASTQDTNPQLRPIGHPVNITVSGRSAKSLELLGKSAIRDKDGPIAERIRMVALQGKQGLVLYLVFVAPDVDFDMMRPIFDRIMRGFTAR